MKITNLKSFFEAKIEGEMEILSDLLENQPSIGEIRVEWFPEMFEEENGEFVTVERWNGISWEQHGLDVHNTVGDLLDLSQKLTEEADDYYKYC